MGKERERERERGKEKGEERGQVQEIGTRRSHKPENNKAKKIKIGEPLNARIPEWIRNKFPVSLGNRLMSAVLEPVLSHTEKSCLVSYYRQFSTNIKIIVIKLIPVL